MSKVLFLAKATEWCDKAEKECLRLFGGDVLCCRGVLGDPFPSEAVAWAGDIMFSFLSPWIIPQQVLRNARLKAVNFHPGPPEYPGIGCYNFALYDGAVRYGVTAHEMEPRVDTGRIIGVSRFMVDPFETVESLKEKSMRHMLGLFYSVAEVLAVKGEVTMNGEAWARRPYTRRELNDLCRIDLSMDAREVSRRIRATMFPGAPGAWLEFHGNKFSYDQK